MTPSQFYAKYKGVWTQESPSLGPQCVWAFKLFCMENSLPVKATPNNWADGYWFSKDDLGFGQWFEYITDYRQFREGDWVIWGRSGMPGGSQSHPSSHIAMYLYKATGNIAMEFSLNQGGDGRFTAKGTVFSDALGALRYKGYAYMDIQKGYSRLTYNGIQVDIVRASADKGYKLHLISAEAKKLPEGITSCAIKDLMEFDDDRLGIAAAVNCNFFQQNNGMHLGCEGDGWTNGYWQKPEQPGIISYYITKDGQIGAHDQSTFFLKQEDIQVVCAPYAVLIHQGQNVNMRSTAFDSKELIKNTQTAAMRIHGDWCLAIFSECYPSDVLVFANEAGADELAIMDSGGSCQMFECSTTGSRKSVRHTARLIPNVLVLAKELDEPGVTPEPEPSDPEPEPEPVIEPDTPDPGEGGEDMDTIPPGMSNETFDRLRYLAEIGLPALAKFITGLGVAFDQTVLATIGTVVMLTSTFIGQLVNVKRNEYNARSGE